jgi:hypothetical protein
MKRKNYLKPSIEALKIESIGLLVNSANQAKGTYIGVNNDRMYSSRRSDLKWILSGGVKDFHY